MKKIVDLLNNRKMDEKITLKDLCKFIGRNVAKVCFILFSIAGTPEARRGILLSNTVMCLYMFTGPYMFMSYAASIFAESGSTFDPNLSAISMIITQIIGICLNIKIGDQFGRKTLMAWSLGGGSIFLTLLGAFICCFKLGIDVTSFNYTPVFCLSGTVFSFSMGLLPLNIMVQAEVLPTKV